MTAFALQRCPRPRAAYCRAALVLLACIGLLAATGCRQNAAPAAAANDKPPADTKPDFEPQKLLTRPNDGRRAEMAFKPGHWSSFDLEVIANRGDARGRLATQLLGAGGVPLDVGQTPFRVVFERPVVLVKQQLRQLETGLFCPAHSMPKQAASRMLDDQGRELFGVRSPVSLLPGHQWYFVVLAREPDPYRFLQDLDSIQAPNGEALADERVSHYRVRLVEPGQRLELAPNAQGWTTTAYVLWDDREPADLSADQQQAMLDWLHWGGQLIVSGPETLITLRGSFLEPYLPASQGAAWPLGSPQLKPLARVTKDAPITVNRPWPGIELRPRKGASFPDMLKFDDRPLLVERRVGRGRIVVTAFALRQRDLVNWPGFDAFFNACLLRRASRGFSPANDSAMVSWSQALPPEHASERTSQVRYFSRDGRTPRYYKVKNLPGGGVEVSAIDAQTTTEDARLPNQAFVTDSDPDGEPQWLGAAAWNDSSPVSDCARTALREAAGIVVPPARFVFWVLALYLLALVPVNWLLFRLLGRVEWAWAAAPVVALAAAGAVIWSAQLNIGFSRARSELGVIELQPGYDRAHLTRYTAIYSSLGADYQLRFDNPSAVALPFFTGAAVLAGQQRNTVELRRLPAAADEDRPGLVTLDGFQVSSNSTGMVHSEQMLPLEGGIRLVELAYHRYRVENHTSWNIEQAVIVRLPEARRGISFSLGTLRAGEQREFLPDSELSGSQRLFAPSPMAGLDMRSLYASAGNSLSQGETCLVGLVAEPIPRLDIEPKPVPAHIGNVIVAHLDYGGLPEPERDVNSRSNP